MPRFTDQRGSVPTYLTSTSPIETFEMTKWDGGWRPDKAPSELLANELQVANNIELTSGGGIKKRGGRANMTNAVTDLDDIEFFFVPPVHTVSGLLPVFSQQAFAFNNSDGSIYLQTFGQLVEKYYSSGNGANFADTGHSLGPSSDSAINSFRVWPVAIFTWGDHIYMTSLRYDGFSGGSGAGGAWQTEDGTANSASKAAIYDVQNGTWSRPTVSDLDSGDTGNSHFPRARVAFTRYDRVFVANVHMQGQWRYPSRVYWSDPGTATDFQQLSYLTVGADDGTEICAMVPFGEQIIVLKNDSVWTLAGTDEDTFAIYPLDSGKGCTGSYAATANPAGVYFFDEQTCTVWSYNGAQFDEIGKPVAGYIKRNINYNASFKVVLQVVGEQLWLSFPNGTDSDDADDTNAETLMYDLRHKCWVSTWTFGIVPAVAAGRESDYAATYGSGQLPGDNLPYYALSGDTVVQIGWQGQDDDGADVVYSDNGSAYSWEFRTFWYQPGGSRNRVRRIESLLGVNTTDSTITFNLYRNLRDSVWTTYDFDIEPTGFDLSESIVEVFHTATGVDIGRWTYLQVGATASSSEQARINSITLQASSHQRKRGLLDSAQYPVSAEVGG